MDTERRADGRRAFLTKAGTSVLVAGSAALGSPTISGATNFEIERYGDKELKIATVNKLKQGIRNKILSDPRLAPGFLKLAINDALGYNARTLAGGPDASVAMEMDREENRGLKPAFDAILEIKKSLQRTNEISLADVIAYAGGEAMEASGAPRVVVQLGRYDEKKAANIAEPIAGFSWEAPTADGFKAAFRRSGMGGREMALLLCALGSVRDVVDDALENAEEAEEDDLQDMSWQELLPNTFGGQGEMYGKRIGAGFFGTAYLERLLKAEKSKPASLSMMDNLLLSDAEVKSYMLKYAGKQKAFAGDVIDAYQKMTLLGEQYETRLLTD
ncbi:unnamed protein product [Phaeothamnion confervicola]